MKILYSPASPYSAKVRMAARFTELPVASEMIKTDEQPDILISNNPLGKIPVLLTDDGAAVFDSRSIMHFLDRQSGGKLYPADGAKRTHVEVMEALGDGIIDCLVAHVYERRSRPPEKVHQPWLDKQWGKVCRALDYLQENPPQVKDGIHAGHFSLAAMSGYLALRFAGEWEEPWPWIGAFVTNFVKAFPAFEELKPRA